MKKDIKVFFCAMFSVCLMQPWIYNLVLTSAEGGIKNSLMPVCSSLHFASKAQKANILGRLIFCTDRAPPTCTTM